MVSAAASDEAAGAAAGASNASSADWDDASSADWDGLSDILGSSDDDEPASARERCRERTAKPRRDCSSGRAR